MSDNLKIWKTLILLTLVFSLTSCVMLFVVTDSISDIEKQDEKVTENDNSRYTQPDIIPEITDSIAYYKEQNGSTESSLYSQGKKINIKRFFFIRGQYTDSIYNGYSIVVAKVGNSGIIIESQENVTVSASNLGEEVKDWKSKINDLTLNDKPYFSLSDEALKTQSLIRTAKF